MKKIIIILFAGLSLQLFAQEEFLHISESLQISNSENKAIMLVFSGSDWCKPCIQLKKEILDSASFTDLTEQFVFMYLDFPYKKANRLSPEETKHNESLAEFFNPDGQFPKVVLIDGFKNKIADLNYEKGMSCESFISNLEQIIESYE